MARKAFEIEKELAKAKADYHAASDKETAPQLSKRSAAIRKLGDELNAVYTHGAKGENLMGMKVGKGVYEIGDGTNRARGETPDEATANWNAGEFYVSAGAGATVGKSETK